MHVTTKLPPSNDVQELGEWYKVDTAADNDSQSMDEEEEPPSSGIFPHDVDTFSSSQTHSDSPPPVDPCAECDERSDSSEGVCKCLRSCMCHDVV